MTEMELLNEASLAWDDGRKSESLQLMKLAIRKDPSLLAVRRMLAERYRQMGHPDQAGRWGIVFDGWTTDVECDRLARLLASSGVAERHTSRFLLFPKKAPPRDLSGLLAESVGRYRERFGIPVVGLWSFGPAAAAMWLITVLTVGGVISALESTDNQTSVGTIGAVWLVSLTLALILSGAEAVRLKSARWAFGWFLLGAAACAFTIVSFASGWIYS
jgi:hypothetical protein